jgi:hypothetical protein
VGPLSTSASTDDLFLRPNFCSVDYSGLPNNHAANLINFWKNSILYGLIPSCMFIKFCEILSLNVNFHQ